MIPKFSQASESFKAANPHLFQNEPTVPFSEQPPSKEEIKSEKQLQEQIAGFLQRNHTVVIRSRMDRKTSTNLGTPDLLFALNGRAIAFEVKLPGRKPTEEQADMMQRMSRNGWACYIITKYDQAVEIFQEISA